MEQPHCIFCAQINMWANHIASQPNGPVGEEKPLLSVGLSRLQGVAGRRKRRRRRNPDEDLRRLERIFAQDSTWENLNNLQVAKIRAGLIQFHHDCDACILMETNRDDRLDYYYCPKSSSDMGGSLLARYGSEGPEYASYPVVTAKQIHNTNRPHARAVTKLVDLARERGFVTNECHHGKKDNVLFEHGGCRACPPPVVCRCPDCQIPFE